MTKDDLEQIQRLFEAKNKHILTEIRSDIKREVDPLHERLDAQRDQIASGVTA